MVTPFKKLLSSGLNFMRLVVNMKSPENTPPLQTLVSYTE
jgi:hypothetical protein